MREKRLHRLGEFKVCRNSKGSASEICCLEIMRMVACRMSPRGLHAVDCVFVLFDLTLNVCPSH